jgi:cytochrome c556
MSVTCYQSLLTALGLSVGLLVTATAQAAEVDEAIEYRQSVMRVIGWQIGPLGDMARGEIDYDAGEFARRADNLAALVTMPWEGFIEGSLRGDDHGIETDALAAIADDWEGFESRQQTLIEEAATLAELARGDDFNAMRRQVVNVADSCQGCHDDYRAD